ncbi:MAG: MarR family transcriptional regulator [Sphingomonadales bacterium]|nr:MarR family transcriptional regulator [Sphingomonadales bacterium]
MDAPARSPKLDIVFLATDIGRLFRKRFDAAARAYGVTGPQWRVLGTLQTRPGATQTMIAAELEVEAITTGRMIDRLQKAGLVERRPDPADRRAWLLFLTPAGENLLDRLRGTVDVVMDEVLTGFSGPELAGFQALLCRLRDNLSAGESAPAA